MIHFVGDVQVSGFSKTNNYTPKTEVEFGTLLCFGLNLIGKDVFMFFQ